MLHPAEKIQIRQRVTAFRIEFTFNAQIAYQTEFKMIMDRIVSFAFRMDIKIENPLFAEPGCQDGERPERVGTRCPLRNMIRVIPQVIHLGDKRVFQIERNRQVEDRRKGLAF